MIRKRLYAEELGSLQDLEKRRMRLPDNTQKENNLDDPSIL